MLKFLFLIAIGMFSLPSYAGIFGTPAFLEPYLGFKVENTRLTGLTAPSMEIKTSAPYLGLKFGYRSLSGIDINLYGEMTKGQAKVDILANPNDYTKTSAGLQIGINSLGQVKMYLGGAFQNEFKLEDSSQAPEMTMNGPSFHAGVQIKIVSYLNLGIQYYVNQYDKVKGTNFPTGEELDTYYSKIDTQEYSLYLSSTF